MAELLAIVPMPERFRDQFRERVSNTFPNLKVNVVGHPREATPHIASADILMAHHVPDEVLAQTRKLKWVQTLGTGTDGFLSRPSLPKNITVTRMHDVQGAPASEAVISLMLALSRELPRLLRNQSRRVWDRGSARLLENRTVCILGVGRIGEALAPKCKALGMNVAGISSARSRVDGFDRIYPREDLVQVAAECDFLVVLVPLSEETKHIVNRRIFDAMKKTAYIVNIARGGVLNEDDLLSALQENRIAGAALDVFEKEPLPEGHPFWEQENLIITPHAAAMHEGYVDFMLPTLLNNIRCYLDGNLKEMLNIVAQGNGPGARAAH